jgi:hypothetical protein
MIHYYHRHCSSFSFGITMMIRPRWWSNKLLVDVDIEQSTIWQLLFNPLPSTRVRAVLSLAGFAAKLLSTPYSSSSCCRC